MSLVIYPEEVMEATAGFPAKTKEGLIDDSHFARCFYCIVTNPKLLEIATRIAEAHLPEANIDKEPHKFLEGLNSAEINVIDYIFDL